jgi:organic radical activating enzyme
MSAEEVLRSVESFGKLDLVVLTGGEPLRQDIGRLVRLCFEEGYSVQIETNGTLYRSDLPFGSLGLSVVCSPKTGKIDSRLMPFISAYKYVVRYGEVDEGDGLPVSVLGRKERVARPTYNNVSQVFVQPADEGHGDRNRLNTQVAVDVCLKFGYRLGLQIHKIVGLA